MLLLRSLNTSDMMRLLSNVYLCVRTVLLTQEFARLTEVPLARQHSLVDLHVRGVRLPVRLGTQQCGTQQMLVARAVELLTSAARTQHKVIVSLVARCGFPQVTASFCVAVVSSKLVVALNGTLLEPTQRPSCRLDHVCIQFGRGVLVSFGFPDAEMFR